MSEKSVGDMNTLRAVCNSGLPPPRCLAWPGEAIARRSALELAQHPGMNLDDMRWPVASDIVYPPVDDYVAVEYDGRASVMRQT